MFDLFSIDQIYILYWSLPINASKRLLRDQNHQMNKNPSSKRIIFWWKIQGSGWSDPKSIDTHLDQIWQDLQQPNLTSKKNHLSHSFFTLAYTVMVCSITYGLQHNLWYAYFRTKNVNILRNILFIMPIRWSQWPSQIIRCNSVNECLWIFIQVIWTYSIKRVPRFISKPTTVIGCDR